MKLTFACDVSYYQTWVDARYPHRWFIYRACDGTFRDPHFSINNHWAKSAAAGGQLDGHITYIVYRPGVDTFSVLKDMVGTPDSKLVVMIDVERWGGQINGDHSADIAALATKLADWLGSQKRVLIYANRGDFDALAPHRPSWLRCVVAGYSSVQPDFPNMIGWQYSDGEGKYPVPAGFPRSTVPFGNCDHNVFPFHTPAELAVALGVAGDPAEENPLADLTAKQLDQIADAVTAKVWAHRYTRTDDKVTRSMEAFTAAAAYNASHAMAAATDAKNTIGAKVDSVAKVLTADATGVLARVASTQAKVDKLTKTVAALQTSVSAIPTTVAHVAVDSAAIASQTASTVVAKLKALTLKAV